MGQGGAGALAAWAKQLGRSVRGGWVNEYYYINYFFLLLFDMLIYLKKNSPD
jgi:hypothetical protein